MKATHTEVNSEISNIKSYFIDIFYLFSQCSCFLTQVGADVVQTLVNAALSIIDIQYVKFEVHMNGVTRVFDFVSNLIDITYVAGSSKDHILLIQCYYARRPKLTSFILGSSISSELFFLQVQ